MENKNCCCVISAILTVGGILLLLAAAFDILPWSDNLVIFVALACFIINGILSRLAKNSGSCCK